MVPYNDVNIRVEVIKDCTSHVKSDCILPLIEHKIKGTKSCPIDLTLDSASASMLSVKYSDSDAYSSDDDLTVKEAKEKNKVRQQNSPFNPIRNLSMTNKK